LKYLAYIESPLQAFNLMEYIDKYNLELDILIINKKSSVSTTNFSQICSVISNFNIKKTIEIDIEAGKKNVLKVKRLINSFFGRNYEPFTLISGEYRSMVFWYVCGRFYNRKVIIVDDGTATLRIDRRRRGAKRIIRDKIYRLFGYADSYIEPISFFSIYDISHKISRQDSITLHDYDFFKSKMNLFPRGDNIVYVIGSPFLEAGVISGCDIKTTIDMINVLKKEYKQIVYIAHRRERQEKLAEISEHVLVQTLDYPFELLPLVQGKKIVAIAGFYSSLFDNMCIICGEELKVECFYLPESIINSTWRTFVLDVYNNYKKYPENSFVFRYLP